MKAGGNQDHKPFITKGDKQYARKQFKNNLEFFVYHDDWGTLRTSCPEDWESEWHHLVGVYDGSALKLYVDGQAKGATSFSGNIRHNRYRVNIARNAEKPGRVTEAELDEVRIYNRALSAEEIREIYRDNAAIKEGQVLRLTFDE